MSGDRPRRVVEGDRLLRSWFDYVDRRIRELMPFVTADGKLNLNSRDIIGQLPGKSGGTNGSAGVTIRGAADYDDSVAPTTGEVVTWDGTKYHPAPPTPIAAKGDLVAGDAAGAPAPLPIGADGDVPIADATQPLGIRWGAPAVAATTLSALIDVALADLRDGDALIYLASDGKWHNRHAPRTITLGGVPVTLDGDTLTLGV